MTVGDEKVCRQKVMKNYADLANDVPRTLDVTNEELFGGERELGILSRSRQAGCRCVNIMYCLMFAMCMFLLLVYKARQLRYETGNWALHA